MGEVRAKVKFTNAVDEALCRQGKLSKEEVRTHVADAMMDAGAVQTAIPNFVLEKLGVAPRKRRVVEHADGRKDIVGVGEPIIVEIDGRDAIEEALALGDEALIGQTVLEKLDSHVDGANRRVFPNLARPDEPVTKIKQLESLNETLSQKT
ncbi:MAG: hypothetical protein NZM06_06015 [Chloroherpetonaceae bacterium]|nr:hypothetical protein [Chloroherpetonaceae bacterium]MDW8438346.1 hypothetical protein [Chloroherpetonaceae bacterium]